MNGTIRALLLIGSLTGVGCIVGPQGDLPDTPNASGGDQNRFDGDNEGAAADGDADGDEPPSPEAGMFDGEDPYWAGDAENDPSDDGNTPDAAAGAGVLEDSIPGLPTIPRPGLPPISRGLPDLDAERSDDPAPPGVDTPDAADAPGDDFTERPYDDD